MTAVGDAQTGRGLFGGHGRPRASVDSGLSPRCRGMAGGGLHTCLGRLLRRRGVGSGSTLGGAGIQVGAWGRMSTGAARTICGEAAAPPPSRQPARRTPNGGACPRDPPVGTAAREAPQEPPAPAAPPAAATRSGPSHAPRPPGAPRHRPPPPRSRHRARRPRASALRSATAPGAVARPTAPSPAPPLSNGWEAGSPPPPCLGRAHAAAERDLPLSHPLDRGVRRCPGERRGREQTALAAGMRRGAPPPRGGTNRLGADCRCAPGVGREQLRDRAEHP